MTMEYHHFGAASSSLEVPNFWDSPVASTATQRVLIISWKPPPSEFGKVNFDSSARGAKEGIRYIIRDPDGRILAARASSLFEPSIPEAKLIATWMDIICSI